LSIISIPSWTAADGESKLPASSHVGADWLGWRRTVHQTHCHGPAPYKEPLVLLSCPQSIYIVAINWPLASYMTADTSSKPTFQVTSCGLPCTGTTTTGRALSILLSGLVFDGGSDSFSGPPQRQRQLLLLASRCPVRTPSNRTLVLDHLRELTEGCVASTHLLGCYFI
jgi:hypothetical protein